MSDVRDDELPSEVEAALLDIVHGPKSMINMLRRAYRLAIEHERARNEDAALLDSGTIRLTVNRDGEQVGCVWAGVNLRAAIRAAKEADRG